MKGGMGGARPRLMLVYENTPRTVHSTKQQKSRGPEGPRPDSGAKSFLPVQLAPYGPEGELLVVDVDVVPGGVLPQL